MMLPCPRMANDSYVHQYQQRAAHFLDDDQKNLME